MAATPNPPPNPIAEFVEGFFRRNQSCADNPTVQAFLGMVRKGEYNYPEALCGMVAALCNQHAELTRALEKARSASSDLQ